MAWYKAIRRGVLRAHLERQKLIDWAAVQRYYDEGHSYRECRYTSVLRGIVDEGGPAWRRSVAKARLVG